MSDHVSGPCLQAQTLIPRVLNRAYIRQSLHVLQTLTSDMHNEYQGFVLTYKLDAQWVYLSTELSSCSSTSLISCSHYWINTVSVSPSPITWWENHIACNNADGVCITATPHSMASRQYYMDVIGKELLDPCLHFISILQYAYYLLESCHLPTCVKNK